MSDFYDRLNAAKKSTGQGGQSGDVFSRIDAARKTIKEQEEPEAVRPPAPAKQEAARLPTPAPAPTPAPTKAKQQKKNFFGGKLQFVPNKLTNALGNIFKGTAKQTASNYGNAATTLYATGQGQRDQQNKEFQDLHEKNLNNAKRDLQIMLEDNRRKPGTWTEKDLQVSRNIIEHESRFVDAGKKAAPAQKKATETAWESMDQLTESGAKDIEQAKEGLGKAGRFAVDVGAAGLGMAGDAAAAALTGGNSLVPMAVRGFGGGAQEARQGGATLGQQMTYGLGSAGISVATEKLSNATKPFAKMFGKGVADDLVEDAIGKAVSRAAKTAAGKTALDGILRAGAGFAGEGLEEFLEDVASPILKRATWDPKAQFDLQEAVYDFLVGGTLGGLGGAVDVVGGAKGRHQDYAQQAKNQSIDRAYDVMGRYGMFDPRARAAMEKATEKALGRGGPARLAHPQLERPESTRQQERTAAAGPTLGSILQEYGGGTQQKTGGTNLDSQVNEILQEYRKDHPKEHRREGKIKPLAPLAMIGGQWTEDRGPWRTPTLSDGTVWWGDRLIKVQEPELTKPDVKPLEAPRVESPVETVENGRSREAAAAETAERAKNAAEEVSSTFTPGERSGEAGDYTWHMENHRYGPYYELTVRNRKTGEVTRRSGDLRREKPQALLYEMVHEDASKAPAAEVPGANVGETAREAAENHEETTRGQESTEPKREYGYNEPERQKLDEDLSKMPPKLRKVGVAPYRSVGNYQESGFLAEQVKGMKSMRRRMQKLIKEFGADPKARKFAQDVAAGTLTMEDVPSTVNAHDVEILADYYRALNSGSDGETLAMRRREILAKVEEDMEPLLGMDVSYDPKGLERHRFQMWGHEKLANAANGVRDSLADTFGTFRRNTMTPARIAVKEFGREHGKKIYDYFFHPVVENNGRQMDWINSMLDRVREFKDSNGVTRKLTEPERLYVMDLVENGAAVEQVRSFNKQYQGAAENVKNGWPVKKAADEFGIKEWSQEYRDLESYAELLDAKKRAAKDTNVDLEIAEAAAKAYSNLYAELYDAINEFLVAHGYETIGFIKGYAPHLQPDDVKTPLKSALKLLGIDDKAMDLPTSIAGQTADLKPYKQYDPFFQERTSKDAEYNHDIVSGFESYVQYLGNIFYHTDDIMRLRTASKYLRKTYATEEASELIGWAEAARNYSLEDKISFLREYAGLSLESNLSPQDAAARLEEYIGKLYDQVGDVGRYNELVKFIDNYANRLAGKQSEVDRGVEHSLGRRSLNWVNSLTGRYGGAKIAYNISSALNQMSQLPMAFAENGVKSSMEAIRDFTNRDARKEFIERSNYLKTKKGIDWISEPETMWEKFKENGFKMAEVMDSFTSYMAVRSKYNQLHNDPNTMQQYTEAEKMRIADEYGRSLMGSRAKGEKPVIFDNKNPFWQVLGKFQLEVMNTWDHVFQDMPNDIKDLAQREGRNTAARELAKRVGTYELYAFLLNSATGALYGGSPAPFDLVGNLLESLAQSMGLTSGQALMAALDRAMEAVLDEGLMGDDDDEDEDRKLDVAAGLENFGGNVLNDIPLVSRFAALAGIGDQSLPMADLSTIWDTGKAIKKNGLLSPEAYDKGLKALSEFAPGGNQLRKTGQGLQALAQGGVYSGDRLKYPVLRSPANVVKGLAFGRAAFPEADEYYASGSAPLGEKPTAAYQHLVKNGFDARYAYEVLDDIRGAETKAEAVDRISKTLLPENEKMYLYQNVASQEGDKRAPKFRQMMATGMDWNQINKAWQEYARLDGLDLKASEQATRFSRWVDGQHLNEKQKALVKDTFKFFSQIPADAGAYETYTGAGLTPDESMKLVDRMNTLKPEGGSEQVSTMQKAAVVLQSGLPESKTVAVLQEILPESTAKSMTDLYNMGVKPDVYLDYKQAFDDLHGDKDANGRDIKGYRKKDKALAMIDGMELGADQKTALYYASGYKSSTLDEAPWVRRGEGGYWAP